MKNNNTIKRLSFANKAALNETKEMVMPIVFGTAIGCGIRVITGQKEHLVRDALVVSGGLLAANYVGGLIYEYHCSKELIVDEFEDEFNDYDEIIEANEEEECC
jgi:hypothetical protein